MGSLMLLDSASLYFRAFFGVPETVRAPDGTPVNAIRGLLDMITRLVRARHPARLVACWDADWRPAFRVAAVPSYKAHRLAADGGEEVPPALSAQVPLIEEVLLASGLVIAGQPGYEADDVIGTLAARSPDPVDVVTGDRDLHGQRGRRLLRRAVRGKPVRLVGGHRRDAEGRPPVRVQARDQLRRVPGPDQPADHVEQPAYRVDRGAVRRPDGLRHAEEGAIVQRRGVK